MQRLLIVATLVILAGCQNHPVDCAAGFPWKDCLPGTKGFVNYKAGKRLRPSSATVYAVPRAQFPQVAQVHPLPPYHPAPVTMPDPCAMMSCPGTAAPAPRYVPVEPGSPFNAGLNSYGYPTQ